ncbi:MAG: type II secretion system F family protein [Methanosarcinales archaeon]
MQVKFEQRVRTVAISRIIRLITRASESSGDVRETLRVAANYAELSEKLRREKFTILISHLIVIYISFGVFLLVLYVFAKMFFPQMPDTSSGATLAGAGRFSMGAEVEEYTTLFMHAAVIQGFFSGIIAGQMMGTGARDGLKHSIIMVATAYALFTLFI